MTRPSLPLAACLLVLAGPALALNPQPLPPRIAPIATAPTPPRKPPPHRTPIKCVPPKVARHMKVHGHYAWRCIKLKVA